MLEVPYGKYFKISDKLSDKQCRPGSDCFFRSSLIRDFPVPDMHFVNSSHDNEHFIWEHKKEKSVENFRTSGDKISTRPLVIMSEI